MQLKRISLHIAKQAIKSQYRFLNKHNTVFFNNFEIPFVNLYQKITGQTLSSKYLEDLRKKEPNIAHMTTENLHLTLDILKKFGISPEEACCNPHLFCMNVISMDNYGEIFKECGFTKIIPKYLIRYNTIVKSRTISYLKKEGLLNNESNLEEVLLAIFQEWPDQQKSLKKFSDADTSILTIRTSVLERYLEWRLHISNEDFAKYCKNYLPLRHRPMSDIRQAIDIAENIIKFELKVIRRNGFIISSDPVNTKLILENVDTLGGIEIKEAIRLEPAILKNNYNSLLEIRDLLKQYEITEEAQRRCLRVFCMNPASVRDRLNELVNMKEYKVLATNPRVLTLVVHQKKVMNRLSKIQTAKKQCFSLNHLVSAHRIFNTYINSFGSKVCSRDIVILITTSLQGSKMSKKTILGNLKRHKYWLHTSLHNIYENICLLKQHFPDQVILDNCHLLLYPALEIEKHIKHLQKMRNGDLMAREKFKSEMDTYYANLNYSKLSDSQILSLTLYEIEKKYHFSGDGIWNKQDGAREEKPIKKSQQN
ncbi:unnamed protein product [Colias eurytheme]|nr:unnamed protein product [Colias eurytheme]